MKKTKKKITTDGIARLITDSHESLARSVAQGFAGVDKRFESLETGLNKKIDNVEARLSQQITGINNRIDDLALNRATREEFFVLDKRVERIETKLGIHFKKTEHV